MLLICLGPIPWIFMESSVSGSKLYSPRNWHEWSRNRIRKCLASDFARTCPEIDNILERLYIIIDLCCETNGVIKDWYLVGLFFVYYNVHRNRVWHKVRMTNNQIKVFLDFDFSKFQPYKRPVTQSLQYGLLWNEGLTSSTLFFWSALTGPASTHWLIALMMMWRFDLELGFTNNLGPD